MAEPGAMRAVVMLMKRKMASGLDRRFPMYRAMRLKSDEMGDGSCGLSDDPGPWGARPVCWLAGWLRPRGDESTLTRTHYLR
jgi:hypothetical protein